MEAARDEHSREFIVTDQRRTKHEKRRERDRFRRGAVGLRRLGSAQFGDISDLKLAKPEDKIDFKSTPPPPGAIVLFDGKNLDKWVKTDGKSAPQWMLVEGGAAQVKNGGIMTKEKFDGHFKLHVEFRVPYMPKAQGQGRGNSGVYLQGRYEVQVLNSYGLKSKDDDCGGIYKVAVPLVNACKAPTVWQAYDIDFRARLQGRQED